MSIKNKLIEKVNPSNRSEKKWYANTVNQGSVEKRGIAQKLSLTSGDVDNVMNNTLEEVAKTLAYGKTIKLRDFGSFRISISSEGADSKEAFNTNMIKTHIIFTPGRALKDALDTCTTKKNRKSYRHHCQNSKTNPLFSEKSRVIFLLFRGICKDAYIQGVTKYSPF